MKNFLNLSILFFILALVIFVPMVQAADTAVVTATVTAQNISVTVTDGSITYGTLSLNASKSTLSGGVNDQQTATNNGNVAEDFSIKGQNSGDWTLDTTNSTQDHYIHEFCTAACGTEASPTNFTKLTTDYQTLGTNVTTSGTKTFDLRVTTPQTSTVYTSQSVDVTVLAVAH
jgi:hypothetical protein